jgi:hypothetical protein
MSVIRIVLGVIVGGCIVAGLLALAVCFRTVAMFVMFGAAGGAILALAYHGLRTGVVGARRSRYERRANPFVYWFYISFYTLIGIAIFSFAACCLLYPEFLRQ